MPPAIAWVAITSPAWAAVVAPTLLGYFLVAFSVYWLWRSLEFSVGLLIGLARLHGSERRNWAAFGEGLPGYERMHHLVLVPTYREGDEVLAATLDCIRRQTVAAERIAVVLAFEERDPDAAERAARLSQRYADAFGHLLVTPAPRSAGRGQGQVVQPALGRAPRAGRVDRQRSARRSQLAGDRV